MTRAAVGKAPFLRGPSKPDNFTEGPGYTADANLSQSSGCIDTTLDVSAFPVWLGGTSPAPGDSGMILNIIFSQFDNCTSELKALVFDQVPIPQGALTIARNLTSGSLATTQNFQDSVSGGLIPITVDLTWTATESGATGTNRTVSEVGGVVVRNHTARGSFANAHVEGLVSTPSDTFAADDSTFGQLANIGGP